MTGSAGVLVLTAVVLLVVAAIPGRWKGDVRWELLAAACVIIAAFLPALAALD